MVQRDMVTRLRPVLGILAALVLVVAVATIATTSSGADAVRDPATIVLAATAGTAAPTPIAPRSPRAPALAFALLATGAVAVSLSSPGRWPRAVTSSPRRRALDDGHDWRSLLIGAPPAAS
jgi:hypothetical protein